jgi:rod shape-determining protein MreC
MRDTRGLRVVLSILIVVTLTLIVLDLRGTGSGITTSLRQVVATAFSPVQVGLAGVTSSTRGWFESIGELQSASTRADALQVENDRLESLVIVSGEDRRRAQELDELLLQSRYLERQVVPARVIAIGPTQRFSWSISLDAGTRDGVSADQSVVTGKGLVGRTIRVSPWSAEVLLLTDPTSSIGARITGSGEIGFVKGTGLSDELEFDLLDPFAPMKVGDRVLTWGSDEGKPFLAGIPVGEVVRVSGTPGQLTRRATVRPFANLSAIDLVGVVIDTPRSTPRQPLE